MGTLLHNHIAPLWVWIVVIAIGSVLLIGAVVAIILYRVRKHRAKSVKDLESGGLTRRVTLKNGKLVEQTKHISLTGSNFGLMSEQGPDLSASPATARGASPFEWWTSIRERSASRQSQRSQDTTSVLDNSTSTANSVSLTTDASPSRLSLTSLNEKYTARSMTSLSDVSTISKPLIAVTTESRRGHAVNFSRPQPHHTPTNTTRNQRLSIIDETTPRSSFLSISSLRARIVSWASSPNEQDRSETAEAGSPIIAEKEEKLDQNYVRVSENAPIPTLGLSPSLATAELTRVTSLQRSTIVSEPRSRSPSPFRLTPQQLASFLDAPTPEILSRHPSRRSMYTNTSEPQVSVTRSRSTSANNFSRKPMLTTTSHSRTNSATNFSRKPPIGDHSPSNSMNRCNSTTNFSRSANVSDNSRTNSNTSWFEAPVTQATLSEPFDMPIANRESRASVWSSESREVTLQQQKFQSPADLVVNGEQTQLAKSYPKTVASEPPSATLKQHYTGNDVELSNGETSEPEKSKETEKERNVEKRRSRGQSTDREKRWSRGPIRARSVNKGRNVLRKRSLHRPETQTTGTVNPSSLEVLDVIGS